MDKREARLSFERHDTNLIFVRSRKFARRSSGRNAAARIDYIHRDASVERLFACAHVALRIVWEPLVLVRATSAAGRVVGDTVDTRRVEPAARRVVGLAEATLAQAAEEGWVSVLVDVGLADGRRRACLARVSVALTSNRVHQKLALRAWRAPAFTRDWIQQHLPRWTCRACALTSDRIN